MDHGELTAKDAPSLESVHEVKLEALLHDLLKKEGRLRAARMLGSTTRRWPGALIRGGCRCICGRRS